MAQFKILQENGQDIYPVTHPDAVRDENGKSVKSELTELSLKVGKFSEITPTLSSGVQIATLKKEVKGQEVETPLYAPQGGGESGKRGVISQTQTWASDYSGYTMSNLVWGTIPQANMDLFLSAGAEFNDTDAPITKTAPWGETVQHLPGYFYLNGLGDISYQEMIKIYSAESRYGNAFSLVEELRTTFSIGNKSKDFAAGIQNYTNNFTTQIYYFFVDSEVFRVCADNRRIILSSNSGYVSYFYDKVRHVLGVIDVYNNPTSVKGFFFKSTNLVSIKLYRIRQSYFFEYSSKLNNASILYMIQNAANGTTDITITLHADAYVRAMADTDIQAALEANGHITLASA